MIDLTKIDWTKLSPEEFSQINAKLVSEKKLARKQSEKVKGTTLIEFRGKTYEIKLRDYKKLIAFKSKKSREKFLINLILQAQQIQEIWGGNTFFFRYF